MIHVMMPARCSLCCSLVALGLQKKEKKQPHVAFCVNMSKAKRHKRHHEPPFFFFSCLPLPARAPWRMSVTISSKFSCSKMKTLCLCVEQMLSTPPAERTRYLHTQTCTHTHTHTVTPWCSFWPQWQTCTKHTVHINTILTLGCFHSCFVCVSPTHTPTHGFTSTSPMRGCREVSSGMTDIDGWLSQLSKRSPYVFITRCTLTRSI